MSRKRRKPGGAKLQKQPLGTSESKVAGPIAPPTAPIQVNDALLSDPCRYLDMPSDFDLLLPRSTP